MPNENLATELNATELEAKGINQPATPGTPVKAEAPSSTSNEDSRGFPADTPLAEMTQTQQLAYWKYQSRKHETLAKQRGDYDQIVAELNTLKQAALTDHEKAIADARTEGEKNAYQTIGQRIVETYVQARLGDKAPTVLAGINAAAFIDESHTLDIDKINTYLSGWITDTAPSRDPHQGKTSPRQSGGMQAGREMARRKTIQRKD